MNIGVEAAAMAAGVFNEAKANFGDAGPELEERAKRVTEMAAQLFIDQLSGVDTAADLEIVQARFQALKAAGASALAGALVSGLRAMAVRGIGILATL